MKHISCMSFQTVGSCSFVKQTGGAIRAKKTLTAFTAPNESSATTNQRLNSIHRVSRSLPRLDSAFQHLDVGKALRLIFRCLTDSAGFAGSTSIENDFLSLRQRRRPGLQAGEGYGPVEI